jgi:hypothetical protein
METWWSSMDIMLQIAWVIALITSLIFVIQMIMTFVGMDSNADFSTDMGDPSISETTSTPFQLFTFRNFINFFLGFSWSYIVFSGMLLSQFWIILISVLVGLFVVAGVMFIFVALSRMEESGNISIVQTVGLTASVYIPIPAHKEGKGKIQISVQNSVREYDAMTEGDALKTGNIVKVLCVLEGNLLLVEKI